MGKSTRPGDGREALCRLMGRSAHKKLNFSRIIRHLSNFESRIGYYHYIESAKPRPQWPIMHPLARVEMGPHNRRISLIEAAFLTRTSYDMCPTMGLHWG